MKNEFREDQKDMRRKKQVARNPWNFLTNKISGKQDN